MAWAFGLISWNLLLERCTWIVPLHSGISASLDGGKVHSQHTDTSSRLPSPLPQNPDAQTGRCISATGLGTRNALGRGGGGWTDWFVTTDSVPHQWCLTAGSLGSNHHSQLLQSLLNPPPPSAPPPPLKHISVGPYAASTYGQQSLVTLAARGPGKDACTSGRCRLNSIVDSVRMLMSITGHPPGLQSGSALQPHCHISHSRDPCSACLDNGEGSRCQ